VSRSGRSFGVGVGHRVQQMTTGWVWMTLNDCNPSHSNVLVRRTPALSSRRV
jgi:hypothetical protein